MQIDDDRLHQFADAGSITRIAVLCLSLFVVVVMLVLYLVSAIEDRLALTLVIVENAMLVLATAAGIAWFAVSYLRASIQATTQQVEVVQAQNHDTQMAIVSIAASMQQQNHQVTQAMMTLAQSNTQLTTGKPMQQISLQEPNHSPNEFWIDGKPPAQDVVKVLDPTGNVLRWSADLAEHFILNMWPRVSRDTNWKRDKTKYTKTAEFLLAAGAPLEKVGDSYRWQSGVTREQVVDWYQGTTGRVIETR